jgi:hypothetical protein
MFAAGGAVSLGDENGFARGCCCVWPKRFLGVAGLQAWAPPNKSGAGDAATAAPPPKMEAAGLGDEAKVVEEPNMEPPEPIPPNMLETCNEKIDIIFSTVRETGFVSFFFFF